MLAAVTVLCDSLREQRSEPLTEQSGIAWLKILVARRLKIVAVSQGGSIRTFE